MSDAIYAPWDFESDETSSGQAFSVYDRDGDRITSFCCGESQAKLISAAPELLALAQSIIDAEVEGHMFPKWMAEDARAAIAKAEPRS